MTLYPVTAQATVCWPEPADVGGSVPAIPATPQVPHRQVPVCFHTGQPVVGSVYAQGIALKQVAAALQSSNGALYKRQYGHDEKQNNGRDAPFAPGICCYPKHPASTSEE